MQLVDLDVLKVSEHLPLEGALDKREPFKVCVYMTFNPAPEKSYRVVRVNCNRVDGETEKNEQLFSVEVATQMLHPESESPEVNEAIDLVCSVARQVFQKSMLDLIEQEFDRIDHPDLFGADPEPSDPVN